MAPMAAAAHLKPKLLISCLFNMTTPTLLIYLRRGRRSSCQRLLMGGLAVQGDRAGGRGSSEGKTETIVSDCQERDTCQKATTPMVVNMDAAPAAAGAIVLASGLLQHVAVHRVACANEASAVLENFTSRALNSLQGLS